LSWDETKDAGDLRPEREQAGTRQQGLRAGSAHDYMPLSVPPGHAGEGSPAPSAGEPPASDGSRLTRAAGKGAPAWLNLLVVALVCSLVASTYFAYQLDGKLKSSNRQALDVLATALGALSVELRVAHYSLQTFIDTQDPGVLADAKSALGPATRLASKVMSRLTPAGEDSTQVAATYVQTVESAVARLSQSIDHIAERTKFYGKLQELDSRFVQRIMPKLLVMADSTVRSTAVTSQAGEGAAAGALTEAERKTLEASAKEIQLLSDTYLDMGILPEDKPAAKVTFTAAADISRKALKLGTDYVYKSAAEEYNKWKGTHYWKITFAQADKTLTTFVDAITGRFAGYVKSGHAVLQKGEMPAATRGEALAKARTMLAPLQGIPDNLIVGPVEFQGTWQVTFWPKSGQVIQYCDPIVVWVDPKSNEPYGYQYLTVSSKYSTATGITAGYATTLAKKYAERGFMKEAFKIYRGSTYLALFRSPLTATDTLVWAAEFVISARYHENTGYDMAIVLVNARDGRYEGYMGLGDGPWRVDRWQLK